MSKRIFLAILVMIGFFSFLQEIETPQDVTLWAGMHYVMHAFILYTNIDKIKNQYAPHILFIGGFNLFTYGITPFFINQEEFQFGTLDPFALQITFFVLLVFYIVYSFVESRLDKYQKKKVIVVTAREVKNISFRDKKFLKNLQLIFLGLYFFSQILSFPVSGLDNIIAFYTCGLLLVGFYMNINNAVKNVLLVVMVLFESFQAVSTGLIFPLIFFSIFLFVVGLNTYKSSVKNTSATFAFFGVVLLFSILFSSVREEYRLKVRWDMSNAEKLNLMNNLIFNSDNSVSQERLIKDTKTGPLWRMSYPISAMSMILEETPKNVPYWEGSSYYPIIYKWIPRFIWPDKPSENMGQIFGHAYELIGEDNLDTSMNTPIFVEAYMNFSYIGLFLLAILMGIMVGYVFWKDNLKSSSQYSGSKLRDVMKILKVATLAVFYCQWESNLSMLIGKIIILYFVDLALQRLFLEKTSDTPAEIVIAK